MDYFKDYKEKILKGDRRFLAKTITLIESSLIDHQKKAAEIIDSILPYTGNSIRLGITGVPGVGKSTFIESFGMTLIKKGHKVAVLAVDPSSVISGGSILGDRTRMEKLSAEESAFIRPSSSGGALGGVGQRTKEAMLLCEAAGFDVLIIETVGVGQSETMVASMVDFFLVLMLSGAGDELQGIKKGILEIADAIAINKADGDNIKNAKRAKREYETALHFLTPKYSVWSPPVLTCSAVNGEGIKEIWDTVLEHKKKLEDSGEFLKKRRKQILDWFFSIVDEKIKKDFYNNEKVKKLLPDIITYIKDEKISPFTAAFKLFSKA
jgi:LAO/AO transport system kinase